jgi:5-hydroxyisourate hydrolase
VNSFAAEGGYNSSAVITTHVLDTSLGRPAVGVAVVLERSDGGSGWSVLGRGDTDADGRLRTLLPADAKLVAGRYRMVFDTRTYFEARNVRSFYPTVVVIFDVTTGDEHLHVPLLLSPYGYTTYRGS